MALLSIAAELDRAYPRWPFNNGYELESWSDIWCEQCTHFETCPLLTVMLMGRTPAAWEVRDVTQLNRYTCHEFDEKAARDAAA